MKLPVAAARKGVSARPGVARFYKQAHYSGHRSKQENRVNEQQVGANVAVAAAEPTLLDRELPHRVYEPHDAHSHRQSPVNPATERSARSLRVLLREAARRINRPTDMGSAHHH